MEVPPVYFAKYPVTNKLYRRFIAGLEQGAWGSCQGVKGSEQKTWGELTRAQFAKSLLREAEKIKGFVKYLGKDHTQWADKLRSRYNDDKRFNDDEKPVVGVSWFAATAYCHWLNEMQGAGSKGREEKIIFRLPNEVEWEWAATGGKREFSWGNEPPDDKRANYAWKVGKTTPVGSYHYGATPEGLMDMAGNVWEWNENLFGYERYNEARALRGGSWSNTAEYLCGVARYLLVPDLRLSYIGFRVACASSPNLLRL